jgi:DNA-binding response OmpR family regulator
LVEAFEGAGFEVFQCADGTQLAATLHATFDNEDNSVQAVVTDIRMPELSGLEILDGVREANRDLPFFLITAFGDEETHNKAEELNAIVVDKPFDVDDLVALVAGLPGEVPMN